VPYATEADLVGAAGGLDRLSELTNRPAPAGELDPRAYWIAWALEAGDAAINAYLPPRYATPLANPSPYIRRLAADEAVYCLASKVNMATEDEVRRAEERYQAYRDLRDGKIWPGDPAPTPTRGRRSVLVHSRGRGAHRKWKGFI
jgi:phage gp36-like protein